MKRNSIKKLAVYPAFIACLMLTGCSSELATNRDMEIDIIDTQDDTLVKQGVTQELDVPYHNFKLVINYKCNLKENEKWTITSDKAITMSIKTDGLDEDTNVYIDNIHTDTSVVSYFPTIDGVIQDTMDDRIHNSLMYGFPISDTNSYVGVNEIEGQNESFISGYVSGYNGFHSGSIDEKRRVESDYIGAGGVYGNKISSVVDLIIEKDGQMQCVSVPSSVLVSSWPYVAVADSHGNISYRYYYFDFDDLEMKEQKLSEEQYQRRLK